MYYLYLKFFKIVLIMIQNVCVLIPSHICYENQITLLKKTINSLKIQTKQVDILLSISFENEEYRKDFDIDKDDYVFTFISECRRYQMDHLFQLLHLTDNYDLVFFCDDDDTFEPERVEMISILYSNCLENKIRNKTPGTLGGFIEIIDIEPQDAPEYWCYAITPTLLKEFFHRFEQNFDLLNYDYGDMYFRNFLRLVNGFTYCSYRFEKPLYHHLIHENSICAKKLYNTERYIRNVIILMTICMYNIEQILDKIKVFNITEEQLKDFVPELNKIKDFILVLYDKIPKTK